MIKYKNCLRCGSENIDLLFVNVRVPLNYAEVKTPFGGAHQTVVNPTDALVCKNCGHVEFFIDWEKK